MHIRDEQDAWQEQLKEIATVIINYFKDLFSLFRRADSTNVLACVPSAITDEMNDSLCCDFVESEVYVALNQMAPLEALGPDGMPPLFCQHFWGTIDHDVTSSILSWMNSGTLPSALNHIFITLILKTNSPEYVHQFCPISLCNVLYKFFSKVLANRLKILLPTIITKHQFAFTKDRLIFDNILVAFETLHCMKKKKKTLAHMLLWHLNWI